MTFGGRVRQRRAELGWSAGELARRAGVSRGYLSKLEGGTSKRPSADVLNRLAAALGTTSSDLLGREEPSETSAIPESLRRFAEQAGLPDEDVAMLARIRYRGEQPRTPEDWAYLLESIKRSIRG